MSAHDHRTHVPGCFRCDLSREETEDQMTFTDRAMRHFEETYDMARLPMPGTLAVEMAEWAASLPPTDEEVLAALNAYTGEDDWDIESWGSYADDMRAALTAAREAQR